MGVRLIRYSRTSGSKDASASANDHDALINRDLLNQHPIYAIIGLQEVLNILEDSIADTNRLLLELEANVMTKYDTQISVINNNIDEINLTIDGILAVIPELNVIDNVIDTKSVNMDYNTNTNSLKADVNIHKDNNNPNILQLLDGGLFVPQLLTKNTNSVTLSLATSGSTIKKDTITAEVNVSKMANNTIKVNTDGLYSEAFLISTTQHNALIKDTAGYYVEAFRISAQANNVLQKLDDGYYVRDTYNYKTVNQNAHNFTVGQFIYYHHNNKYQLASAIDSYDSNIVGMVTKVIDANNFEYMWGGFFPTTLFSEANGYTQGMPIYISDTIPGGVTQTQPDISKGVGYPVENKGLIISIERGIQYNQEATIGDFKRSANNYDIRSDGFIKIEEGINYKLSIVLKLLDVLTDDFKDTYIDINDNAGSISFKNVQTLKTANGITTGFNLYIKAF